MILDKSILFGITFLFLTSLAVITPSRAEDGNRFTFREPALKTYQVEQKLSAQSQGSEKSDWLIAVPVQHPEHPIELGSRVILEIDSRIDLKNLLRNRPFSVSREVQPGTYILQGPDAWTAAEFADGIAQREGVEVCCPVIRRPKRASGLYAHFPNDPDFADQVYLENRSEQGTRTGPDLNVRAAWPFARGEGITIAIVDDGLQTTHPDLRDASAKGPHFDFANQTDNFREPPVNGDHATAVAGIAAARGENHEGISGVAPQAGLASWLIFGELSDANDEAMMDMFQYQSNVVQVQNHSWGPAASFPSGPSLLERMGIDNAVENGRNGKGVVMVRAAGNNRTPVVDPFFGVIVHPGEGDVNEDGYANDPKAIAVGAIGETGRATTYSSPGAAVLVTALSGDFNTGSPSIFTTDLVGSDGANQSIEPLDYRFGGNGFSGTSATSPQIAGLAALLLSANPNLGYRDVQQILALSARQTFPNDPEVEINGAGFAVSHNSGFGVPDAGEAVRLAWRWKNRPPLVTRTNSTSEVKSIPDAGLHLRVNGNQISPALENIIARPSLGVQNDLGMQPLPLFDAGFATNDITAELQGMGALIRRGPPDPPEGPFPDERNFFRRKIERAEAAGAEFAVVYNNDGDELVTMSETDFSPIPAVFIGQTDGEALLQAVKNDPSVRAAIGRDSAQYTFDVNDTLICEHVGLRVQSTHTRRADLRIVLISPQGTRSIMQRLNFDDSAGPEDWTYYSVHHFFESSAGQWRVLITDEDLGDEIATGDVERVELILNGVEIVDSDHDGLEDSWEDQWFGDLSQTPEADPDEDGFINAYEQVAGMNPTTADIPFRLDLSIWNTGRVRLSWPGVTNREYEVLASPSVTKPFEVAARLPGEFPETEFITSIENFRNQIYEVRALPAEQ